MLSVERILDQARKAQVELERLNLHDARELLADVIVNLENPGIRCIVFDDEKFNSVMNQIRHGVED
jgi:hypothetical protein